MLRGNAPASLLDTYEEERRPIATEMLGLSTSVHRGETERGEATRQLGLRYRDSSLTEETRAAVTGVRAGDRAPDGTVAGVRLFDAFRGPHWTLLALGTEAAPELGTEAAPELGAESVHVVRGPAQEPYGTGLFLVRPDGYVGWASDSAAGLGGYLTRLGLSRA
ncbi:hypothetical protein QFZ76_006343 [Streptomyces sp. V4I2]|nr:hypothetical protein [Streptomyces sp. V4I2]